MNEKKILTFIKCVGYGEIKEISEFFSMSKVEVINIVENLIRKGLLKRDEFGITFTQKAFEIENDWDVVKKIQNDKSNYF